MTVDSLIPACNALLRLVGLQIAPRYLGRWSVDPQTHMLRRRLLQIGWRVTTKEDAREPKTDLDRLIDKRLL